MLNALGVALVCELSFLVGLVLGCVVTNFIPTTSGFWQPSVARAIMSGAIIGIFTGATCLWAAHLLGSWLAVRSSWWPWLAFVLPVVGEFGRFLNRRSLKLRGTPIRGVFMPLGRAHAAAWEFLASPIFSELSFKLKRTAEFTSESTSKEVTALDAHEIGVLALQETNRFLTHALWGVVLGAALAAWFLRAS